LTHRDIRAAKGLREGAYKGDFTFDIDFYKFYDCNNIP
jgi:hypothetical protein